MASRQPSDFEVSVFLNIPFGKPYEPLLISLVTGLTALGLVPKSVLQVQGGRPRLNRLFGLIRSCRISIHDLSHVRLDGPKPRTPRFNMPFELGIAVALWLQKGYRHTWYVLEEKPHRIQKSLSDINAFDPFIRGRSVKGTMQALTGIFRRREGQLTVDELVEVYQKVTDVAKKVKRKSGDLFTTGGFRELVIAARVVVMKERQRRGLSAKKGQKHRT